MAKESMKAREVKRVKLAQRYAAKREAIAAAVKAGEMNEMEAWQKLVRVLTHEIMNSITPMLLSKKSAPASILVRKR